MEYIAKELDDTVQAIEQHLEEMEMNMAREIEDAVDAILETHLAPVNDHLVELVTSTDSERIMDGVGALGEKVDALRNKLSQILEIWRG